MKVKYIKPHNNYDLTIGKTYEGTRYKDGWLLITEDDEGGTKCNLKMNMSYN